MIPSGARVWIAMGHTDMRKGMQGLALQVQQGLRDPHGGDLFVFEGGRDRWSRSSGTTASACRFMPNGSRRVASSGPRRERASSR